MAYKAAFDHEKTEYIQQLKVPTTIFRWEGSILKKYNDRIFDFELPVNVSGYNIPADRMERFDEMAKHIQIKIQEDTHYDSKEILKNSTIRNSLAAVYKELQNKIELPAPEMTGAYLQSAWNQIKQNIRKSF